ncbi:hypothetical protein [Pseudoalteromonas luteoviolacea]|uniref:Uncharacterized protein n=1 Tax=Pseudoalteromonas luteoviolacea (strain 2ta16) TaxID=1353533 RepID=V4I3X4_PSEL2|nr:hypothetical protein [Pseudoalteromonas luteoviolacea]ESP94929.1 hypothetical protein PL2TA16_04715 [Pseudoalteromonas luteoviolacea 2ta16]KZN33398.1 hypothetical protein N483_01970 [Pseudoalteromonas luteoviolacea NCIMB 1944]
MKQIQLILCGLLLFVILIGTWALISALQVTIIASPPSTKALPAAHSAQTKTPMVNETDLSLIHLSSKDSPLSSSPRGPAISDITEGDVYIPPIVQSPPQSNTSYSGDLDDHQSYNAYLLAKEHELKHEFIAAVDKKVARINNLLERGIQANLPSEQLQEARDKIAALKTMKAQLIKELDSVRVDN